MVHDRAPLPVGERVVEDVEREIRLGQDLEVRAVPACRGRRRRPCPRDPLPSPAPRRASRPCRRSNGARALPACVSTARSWVPLLLRVCWKRRRACRHPSPPSNALVDPLVSLEGLAAATRPDFPWRLSALGMTVAKDYVRIAGEPGSRPGPFTGATFHQDDQAAWRHQYEARQGSGKESVVSSLSNGGPTPEGQGAVYGGAESPRGDHRHHRRSVDELDRGNHFAAWQEPDLFTTEIRVAFRSLQ